jgi:hypothetical protein
MTAISPPTTEYLAAPNRVVSAANGIDYGAAHASPQTIRVPVASAAPIRCGADAVRITGCTTASWRRPVPRQAFARRPSTSPFVHPSALPTRRRATIRCLIALLTVLGCIALGLTTVAPLGL